jgi:2-haloacid dehalogenase/putative hydrolase of the HAD superfamily
VCLVSDIDRADLVVALAHHGLADRFTAIVTSEDARAYKPRPEPFTTALDALGLAPHEVAHVGDSLTRDVGGAASLGIPAIWVNRAGRPVAPGTPQLARMVSGLTEMADLVMTDCH